MFSQAKQAVAIAYSSTTVEISMFSQANKFSFSSPDLQQQKFQCSLRQRKQTVTETIYNSRNFNVLLGRIHIPQRTRIYNSRNFNVLLGSYLKEPGKISTTVEISMFSQANVKQEKRSDLQQQKFQCSLRRRELD